jgi:Na+-driven multidrug efflux pump
MTLKNRDIDMCNGPLFKKMVLFALPIMAMNLLQLLFNAADMIVVGRFFRQRSSGSGGCHRCPD